MIARFEIGEVSLATSMGLVVRQVFLAVVAWNAPLAQQFPERDATRLGQFSRFSEGKDTLGVEGESQFVFETLGNLFVGQTHALEDRVRDLQGQSDGFILAYSQLPEPLSPIGKPLAL